MCKKGENRIKCDKKYFHWKNFVRLQFVVDWLFSYLSLSHSRSRFSNRRVLECMCVCVCVSLAFAWNMHSLHPIHSFCNREIYSTFKQHFQFRFLSFGLPLFHSSTMLIYFVQLIWLNLLSLGIESLLLDFVS